MSIAKDRIFEEMDRFECDECGAKDVPEADQACSRCGNSSGYCDICMSTKAKLGRGVLCSYCEHMCSKSD